jgi:membrane protease YdiL (CAAX protease family)
LENEEYIEKNPSYLDAATQGNSSGWRYIVGTLSILFIWLVIGGVATAVLLIIFSIFQGLNLADITQLISDPSLLGFIPYYLVLNLGFAFLYIGIWLTVRLLHGRPLRSVVTPGSPISWRRMGVGFVIWAGLLLAGTLLEYLVWPESFTITFDARVFMPFAILAILITPIQTTAEEFFFRGYLVQGGSLISRNWVFLSIWSGVLFALPHFSNPEVASNTVVVMLTFFVLGAFLTWISLKDGSIELAIGVHAANNLVAGLVVTFPDSVLPTPAILTTTHFDPVFSLIAVLIICALLYLLVFVWRGGAKYKSPKYIEQASKWQDQHSYEQYASEESNWDWEQQSQGQSFWEDNDYYKILQVDPIAEPEVISGAYRRLAAKYHPDVYKKEDAPEKIRRLNEAHEVLSDPMKRKEYDQSRNSY